MLRSHQRIRSSLRESRISSPEKAALVLFALLFAAAFVVACVGEKAYGTAPRILGTAALLAAAAFATSRTTRLVRSDARSEAVVPPRLGVRTALAVVLALGAPVAVCAGLLTLVAWAWLPLCGVLVVATGGAVARMGARAPYEWRRTSEYATGRLERLCLGADLPVPELEVRSAPIATAWTSNGRIHVTRRLLELLDEAELDAVLAHELAHIANRDASLMEISSAPSRVLLGFATTAVGRYMHWLRSGFAFIPGMSLITGAVGILAVVAGPPAFVVGWLSRLSVLGISRQREFDADATAARLTGRPSALASALLKLEHQHAWAQKRDLREVEPIAVLCIVGTARSRLGRLFETHPPTALRVKRLERMQADLTRRAPLAAAR